MYQALLLKQPEGVTIPSESPVYRVMKEIGMVHHPKRRPNSLTKADREARKSDDLLGVKNKLCKWKYRIRLAV